MRAVAFHPSHLAVWVGQDNNAGALYSTSICGDTQISYHDAGTKHLCGVTMFRRLEMDRSSWFLAGPCVNQPLHRLHNIFTINTTPQHLDVLMYSGIDKTEGFMTCPLAPCIQRASDATHQRCCATNMVIRGGLGLQTSHH